MIRTRRNDGLAVLQPGEQTQPGFITQTHLLDLPDVMQRYLPYAGVVEKEPGTSPPGSSPGFASRSPKSNTTNRDG